MYLKSANIFSVRSWSILKKLVFLYAVSTFSLLLSIGLMLNSNLSDHVVESDSVVGYFIQMCHRNYIFVFVAGAILSLIVAYYIAKNGLKRLYDFSNILDTITINSLSKKIDSREWPAEIKSLVEKYNFMLDRLDASFAQLSQFSSDIAHELRSPLHSMKLRTEMALSQGGEHVNYENIFQANQEEYNLLSRLIDTLLFLAQSDHGQIKLNKMTFNATQEVANILDYYQPFAEERSIKFTLDGDEMLFMDKTLFKQAISNLISNATKYCKEEGLVSISIKSLSDGSIQITISDNGQGIPEECLQKIFDRFYRVDSSRSQSTGGHGLGLSIVNTIVALHQGSIQIQSEVNVGTAVTLIMPCAAT